MKITLVCLIIVSYVYASCWTGGPYHLAAKALAAGVGDFSSASVCVYGKNPKLNNDCPFSCKAIIETTWGTCYCRDPNFYPHSGDADAFIEPMNVKQLFQFIADINHTYDSTCRLWINEPEQVEHWKCT